MNLNSDFLPNFLISNHFLQEKEKEEEGFSLYSPSPKKKENVIPSPNIRFNTISTPKNYEKKLKIEIYTKLLSEHPSLSMREKEILHELSAMQAKWISLESDFKEETKRNIELLDKNLRVGGQLNKLLEEREDFLKTKMSYERKLRKLGEVGKRTNENYIKARNCLNYNEEKIREIGENKARISIIQLKEGKEKKVNKEKFAPILKHKAEIMQLAEKQKGKKKKK